MALKTTKQPLRSEIQLSSVLYALGDTVRLEIIRQLDGNERACGTFLLDMPKSSLSHHFRVLREAGIVGTRPNGTSLINWLRMDDLEVLFPGLLPSVLRGIRKSAKQARTSRK
ncbi:MAG TPA: ArsR family transcriptional regulator [Pseudacidobacterium sp.]|jgi:DNA-binding transcriptional ArsR family regulator|nr:ArsR family transcriptional regulator [Pseudacidobacterium sp.]